jgi:hypothetical protein
VNQNTPSVINIMITEVFGFGQWNKTESDAHIQPLIGDTNDQQYAIGLSLLLIVVILIPVMLCTKPIMHACLHSESDEDRDEIEFTNINRGDDMSQPLQPGIQRDSGAMAGEDNSRKLTDDMMMKRHREMQSLEN